MRGLMAQQVMIDARGFDVLDDMDWQTFFKTYGASPDSYEAHKSAPVRAFYDLVFGYEDGDTTRPNFAAGAALRSVISIVLLYKGSVFMKMRAGMGDTIFAPFYKALVKRGVRFEYFHRLDRIELGEADGAPVVQALHFGRQATVRGGAYQPFVAVDGLDCWPQAPLTDQLVEGEALLKGPDGGGTEGWDGNWKGYDLEDFWTTWPDAGKVTLNRGEAFDLVVLAVPPASHRFIAKELIDTFPRWATMVEKVGSVSTMAMQLWLKSDITGLGWPHGSVVLDAYQQPMNTWADMSHLIPRESWPATATPGSIAYFCGPMAGGLPAPGSTDPSGKATAEVETVGNAWLASATGTLWPQGSIGAGLDPKELVVTPRFDRRSFCEGDSCVENRVAKI
jgi:uncharacterized protein with NAD-binding domain and iron-sulfur cluster